MIWIIFAHFIGDWGLQSEWVALNKEKYWFVMTAHCMIWTGCVSMAVEYMGALTVWKLFFLFIGHYACDIWKCGVYEKTPFCKQETYWHMYADQGWHLIQCFIVGVI
ncbi:hypothetical protein LCGC14_1521550 [marine sediment metagenome]|uniref:DUF3307 domain-containing protein n=1 Tax=marine sediment metagenome TaxID=412755 RepID=A0A0F9LZK0_9ZZZZ